MAFAYVIIEREDQEPWVVTLGNRDEAMDYARDIRALSERAWPHSGHNYAHVVSRYDNPTPAEARARIETEIEYAE